MKTAPKKEKKLILDTATDKTCPICKKKLQSALFHNTEVDYCPKCLGIFFEDQELRFAKDDKDKDLRWLDIDLWKDPKQFKISYGIRLCPSCRMPLYEVYYGKSGVIVDVCNVCHGIWLDRGEFKKITDWLKQKADYDAIHNYAKDLWGEVKEIFVGPESIRDEILDFLAVLKILRYKFLTQHPLISKLIIVWPK